MIRVIVLTFLTACVCSPGIYAQDTASQGWVVTESKQRPSSTISLAGAGSRYEVEHSTSEAFSSALGQNQIVGEALPPFPVLMPKAIVYPRKAVRRGWEGRTVVAVEVLPDGSVGRTALAKSSGHGILDQAAEEAIQSWKFANETEKNKSVPQYVDIPVAFKLQGEDRS